MESSHETEIWSIYKGLTIIILQKGMTKIHVESDSLVAVELIKNGAPANHSQSTIINDAHALLIRRESVLAHTYRTAKQCADHLVPIRRKVL